MLGYQLPSLYKKFLPKELWMSDIVETKATCNACNWKEYDPKLKCCTYEPFLPNFLVGAALINETTSASALESLNAKISKREFALPIGMVASPRFQVRFNHREPEEFGNREDWICPYYNKEQQNCGIWKNRGAVCTTYFCQSSYGVMGMEFWKQMSDYLTYVEMALMEESLVYLDFSPRQISECLGYLNRQKLSTAEKKSDSMEVKIFKKMWNGYEENPASFYKKTYQLVSEFSKSQFREAIGELGEEIEENLIESLQEVKHAERE